MNIITINSPKYGSHNVMVDDEDLHLFNKYKWRPRLTKYVYYVVANGANKSTIYLHRLIMNPDKGVFIDHIDRNGLNNQRSNLRLCTNTDNSRNTKIQKNNTSGFKGVDFMKRKGKFRARINVSGNHIHIGLFDNAIEAAKAYNSLAATYFKEFARLNVIPNE